MKKVSVIGLFCTGKNVSDGQSVKTRIVTEELEKAFGAENVERIDTYGWKKNPLKLFGASVRSVFSSRNVIFMTDEGGIKIFPWLLLGANVFGKCRLHYVVIGGWLVHFLERHAVFAAFLKRFDSIFAETTGMRDGLESLGFQNVTLLPNCKNLTPLTAEQLAADQGEPSRFCTFSRVMKEKGIEDAVNAVKFVNDHFGRRVCELDIYGAVDPNETDWFQALSDRFGPGIRYCGIVPYTQTTQVLKNYFALLFPTFFPKEGIPGTVIDAYSAGLPVIASRWSSFDDMIDHGITGIGYPYGKNEYLAEILCEVVQSPEQMIAMRENCLKKAEQFLPKNVMKILLEKLV